MPISEQELNELRERHTRTEAAVDQLTTAVGQIADTQQKQQSALGSLTSDMQSILTLLKSREGTFNLKSVIGVVVPLGGFIAFFMAMYLAPLKTQVDNNQYNETTQMNDLRRQLSDHLSGDGTAATQRKFAVIDERLNFVIDEARTLVARERARVEEEAAVGRAYMRGEKPKAP